MGFIYSKQEHYTLDCVSVFARSIPDALHVESVAAAFDSGDPHSRRAADNLDLKLSPVEDVRIGIPATDDLTFFGDEEAEELFDETTDAITARFGTPIIIDFTPFQKATKLLFDGPWVAERLSIVGEFLATSPSDVNSIVADVISRGEEYSAQDTFEAFHRLKRLRRRVEAVLDEIDALIVPTAGTVYTIEEIRSEPIALNSNLGYYTNFVNLLDLAAVSVPTGRFTAGPTFGSTVIGDTFEDGQIAAISAALRKQTAVPPPERPL